MASASDSLPIAARLPPHLVEKVDEVARELGGSRSDAIRKIVDEYEPSYALRPDLPLFDPPLAAAPGPKRDFLKTRYDHVMERGRT